MNPEDLANLLVRDLEGIPPPSPNEDVDDPTDSSLVRWYRALLRKRVSEIDDLDVCRCCGQGFFLDYIVPLALSLLKRDPLYGAWYEGQLIENMQKIREEYWISHPEVTEEAHALFSDIQDRVLAGGIEFQTDFADEELRWDLFLILRRLTLFRKLKGRGPAI